MLKGEIGRNIGMLGLNDHVWFEKSKSGNILDLPIAFIEVYWR